MTLLGLLFLLFLGLKLAGIITWAWLWVTAPLWIPLFCWMTFFSLVGFCICYKEKTNAKLQKN